MRAIRGVRFSVRCTCLTSRRARPDADQHGRCFPSTRELSDRLGIGQSTARRILVALEEDGYIGRSPRLRDNGSQSSNDYRLDPWRRPLRDPRPQRAPIEEPNVHPNPNPEFDLETLEAGRPGLRIGLIAARL